MLIVFNTCPNLAEAETLASKLIEQKLAACVQIIPQITSFYFWDGEVQKDSEFLLLIKTLKEKFDAVKIFIEANHSYSVPEVIAVDAANVSEKYDAWLKSALAS